MKKNKVALVGIGNTGITSKALTSKSVTGASLAANIGQPNPSNQVLGNIESTKKRIKRATIVTGPTPWKPEPWNVVNKVKPISERTFRGGVGRIVVRERAQMFKPGFNFAKTNMVSFSVDGNNIVALNHSNAARKAARL